MNQEYNLYRISQLLSRFKEQVQILNKNGEFSINIHAENILIKVLNEIYDCKLENINYSEGKNYPSIDLRDKSKRFAIQVTSTGNFKKIKDTLSKFLENEFYKDYDKLLIFIITEKQSRYEESKIKSVTKDIFNFNVVDIVDKSDIYRELNEQNNYTKIKKVCSILEEQFADDNSDELTKWNLLYQNLEEYDKYIKNYFQFLDIKGFSPKINNSQIAINLEDIYIPLALNKENNFNTTKLLDNPLEDSYRIQEALKQFNKLVILGDPGSGKSTLLKYLAYQISSKRGSISGLEDLVPILIKGSEFSKYVSTKSKKLSEYIIDYIDKTFEPLFTEKLAKNQLLILIDGIDEINEINLKHSVTDRINSFIAKYPDIKIIVSSRIVGYKEIRLNGHFTHLEDG